MCVVAGIHVEGVAGLLRRQQREAVGAVGVGAEVDDLVERPGVGTDQAFDRHVVQRTQAHVGEARELDEFVRRIVAGRIHEDFAEQQIAARRD